MFFLSVSSLSLSLSLCVSRCQTICVYLFISDFRSPALSPCQHNARIVPFVMTNIITNIIVIQDISLRGPRSSDTYGAILPTSMPFGRHKHLPLLERMAGPWQVQSFYSRLRKPWGWHNIMTPCPELLSSTQRLITRRDWQRGTLLVCSCSTTNLSCIRRISKPQYVYRGFLHSLV